MPSRTPLQRFARLLPRAFRERVFEPALADLLLGERTRTRHLGRALGGVAQLLLMAECVRVLLLQIAWQQISLRRPAHVVRTVLLLLLVTWYLILRARYGHAASH